MQRAAGVRERKCVVDVSGQSRMTTYVCMYIHVYIYQCMKSIYVYLNYIVFFVCSLFAV